MTKRAFIFPVAVLIAIFLIATSAHADGKTTAQCGHEFDKCQNACNEDHKDKASKRAPCVAAYSGKYAACDAGVALETAKPWIEDQARKTKRFFEDLLKELNQPPATDPQRKDKSNSI